MNNYRKILKLPDTHMHNRRLVCPATNKYDWSQVNSVYTLEE